MNTLDRQAPRNNGPWCRCMRGLESRDVAIRGNPAGRVCERCAATLERLAPDQADDYLIRLGTRP